MSNINAIQDALISCDQDKLTGLVNAALAGKSEPSAGFVNPAGASSIRQERERKLVCSARIGKSEPSAGFVNPPGASSIRQERERESHSS
ncbi:MAG: hypothetical protein DRI57_30340 [Deltaproteobacteria bacterium]|nr:MAG: hypothetical protein DRI57_30340 [Deltaproteobacteria bacterium]